MEFRFSCRWFEVHLAGDPGFVEAQLLKYEPFILAALARAKAEMKAEEEKEEGAAEQVSEESERSSPAVVSSRERHFRSGGRRSHGRDKVPGRPYPFPSSAGITASGRTEKGEAQENRSVPSSLPLTVSGEAERSWGEEIGSKEEQKALSSGGRRAGGETEPASGLVGGEKKNSSLSVSPAAVEFVPRRRMPQIRAEELSRLIEEKKPRTHHDRVMIFGYYLEHEGQGSDFTIAEIRRCYGAVNLDAGTNLEQVIEHASRSGFILRHGEGRNARFKLSSKGRRYVEDGLRLS